MPTPGVIQNRARARQLTDFSSLNLNRKRTPGDVDFFMEFGGETFIFGEYKFGDTHLPHGQRRALEHVVDVLLKGGAAAIAFVARHNHPVEHDVDGANALVSEAYIDGEWKPARFRLTVRRFILWYCRSHGVEDLPAK